MQEELKNALWENEEIRWCGRPKPFQLLDRYSKRATIITWIVSAAIALLVLAFLGPNAFRGERSFSDVVVLSVVVLFLPAILSARPLLDKQCLEHQTIYAITNYRIIAVVKDQVMYLPLGKGLAVAMDPSDDGCGNLRFGGSVGKPIEKSRVHAVVGIHDDDDASATCGLLFYHIDQPEQLLHYFV